jgi:hypothetical protein
VTTGRDIWFQAATSLAGGKPVTAVAHDLGINRRTIQRWMQDPAFLEAMASARTEPSEATANSLYPPKAVMDRLRSATSLPPWQVKPEIDLPIPAREGPLQGAPVPSGPVRHDLFFGFERKPDPPGARWADEASATWHTWRCSCSPVIHSGYLTRREAEAAALRHD